jgi:hypothetical protein
MFTSIIVLASILESFDLPDLVPFRFYSDDEDFPEDEEDPLWSLLEEWDNRTYYSLLAEGMLILFLLYGIRLS